MFERLFNVSAGMLAQEAVDLVLQGVDTVADIYVNNNLLLSVSNAHRSVATSCEYLCTAKTKMGSGSGQLVLTHRAHLPPGVTMQKRCKLWTL